MLDCMVSMACLECLDLGEIKVTLDCLEHVVAPGSLLLESQATEVSRETMAALVCPDSRVMLAYLVSMGLTDRKESLDKGQGQDNGETRDSLDFQEPQVNPVSTADRVQMDSLDPLERKETVVFQGLLDLMEDLEKLDHQDFQALMVIRDCQAHPVNLDAMGRQDNLGIGGLTDATEIMDYQVLPEFLE